MAPDDAVAGDSCQHRFASFWRELSDPHVRTLAWLLDSPDLLDADDAQWQGRIATLGGDAGRAAAPWLRQLDSAPQELHRFLALPPYARLGRYAEKLLAFYFQHQGCLAAHGLQVQDARGTVGEFDFLLRENGALLHWEFASKLYLLRRAPPAPDGGQARADYFVGPNLTDTLGNKMNKILSRQLQLARHPAAQAVLPQEVSAARALVKGWLFYHVADRPPGRVAGVAPRHCRGDWCALEELELDGGGAYAILPRLSWLVPARLDLDLALGGARLRSEIETRLAQDRAPLLVAQLEPDGAIAREARRFFVVPDDWGGR